MIMANHGLLAIGETVEGALETAAYAEEGARVFLLARAHGEPSTHPRPCARDDVRAALVAVSEQAVARGH